MSIYRLRRCGALLLVLLIGLLPSSGMMHAESQEAAAVITVNTINDELLVNGNCSLREAMVAANTNTANDACPAGRQGRDIIQFQLAFPATIEVHSVLPSVKENLVFQGPNAVRLFLSGNNQTRLLEVLPSIRLTVRDLSIVNGTVFGDGAGIFNEGILVTENVTFRDNAAIFQGTNLGGAIYSTATGVVTVTNTLFYHNIAGAEVTGLGGAIYAVGPLYVYQSQFTDNRAGGEGGSGGAIYTEGELNVTGSVFTNNSTGGITGSGGAIRCEGPTALVSSTFADNSVGGFYSSNGGAVSCSGEMVITDSTFTGNRATAFYNTGSGGAVAYYGSSLYVLRSNFIGNVTDRSGGAINQAFQCSNCPTNTALTIRDSTLVGNIARDPGLDEGPARNGLGGAVSAIGRLEITNTLFRANLAWAGGALHTRYPVLVSNSEFVSNQATVDGGAINNRNVLTITATTLRDNQAGEKGGALTNISGATATIQQSALYGNRAGTDGAGVWNEGEMTVANSTLSGNQAVGSGGGLANLGNALLVQSTLASNRASSGGNLAQLGGSLTLRNSLVANSSAGGNCVGVVTDGGHNRQYPGASCGAVTVANPRLGPLVYDGGTTVSQGLLPGSPALDTGEDSVCATAPVNGVDQRGMVRPWGARCDIGAYEGKGPPILVSSTLNGSVGGLAYRDEDILLYQPSGQSWSLYLDGSDVGLTSRDVDAFQPLEDGSLLLSLDADLTLGEVGLVDDADILHFMPSSLGENTAGSFQLWLDGTDVGLDGSGEDIDVIALDPADGSLLVSVVGSFRAPGASGVVTGGDEDLFRFVGAVGADTVGVWELYFDGGNVRLTTESEDVQSLWVEPGSGNLYLTTLGAVQVVGVSGDSNDLLVCQVTALGASSACTFRKVWDAGQAGLGANGVDGLHFGLLSSATLFAAAEGVPASEAAREELNEAVGEDLDEANEPDGNEAPNQPDEGGSEGDEGYIYLPLVVREG